MPSKHFTRTYMKAFTQDPVINRANSLNQSSVQNGEADIPDTDRYYCDKNDVHRRQHIKYRLKLVFVASPLSTQH